MITRPAQDVAAGLTRIADWLTDNPWVTHATRSGVGNLALLDADRRYVAWADVLTGEVDLVNVAPPL